MNYRIFVLAWLALAGVAGAQLSPPDISRAQFTIELNKDRLELVYVREGVPGSGEKNGVSLVKGKQKLWALDARPTQDIYLRPNGLYSLAGSSDRQLLLVVLFSSWDGEDPTVRPIFVITDGSKVAATESRFGVEAKTSRLEQMVELVSSFLGRPITGEQRSALENIERELGAR